MKRAVTAAVVLAGCALAAAGWRHAEAVKPPARPHVCWEYKAVHVSEVYKLGGGKEGLWEVTGWSKEDVEARAKGLDVIGRDGWELVSVVADLHGHIVPTANNDRTFYFKRPR